MSRRPPKDRPPVPDFHLWTDVTETVTPLRRSQPRPRVAPALPMPPEGKTGASLPEPPRLRLRGLPIPKLPEPTAPGHGIEPRLRRRVARNRIVIDGTIDLHGMQQVEARAALIRFIDARTRRGDRTLLVITGKGLKKLDGGATIIERGVLRSMLPIWLSQAELAPLIAGWDVAAQHHGGEGAYYVRLRALPDRRTNA